MSKFLRNKTVRTIGKGVCYVVGGKMIFDMGSSCCSIAKQGMDEGAPAKLSFIPAGCVLSGVMSLVTSGVVITGSPFAVPMYAYNAINHQGANDKYHEMIMFPANMFDTKKQ